MSQGLCHIKISVGKMHLTVHLQLKLNAATKKTRKYSTNTFTRQSKWLLDVLEQRELTSHANKKQQTKGNIFINSVNFLAKGESF